MQTVRECGKRSLFARKIVTDSTGHKRTAFPTIPPPHDADEGCMIKMLLIVGDVRRAGGEGSFVLFHLAVSCMHIK